jgi:RHS repeat-associated protein
VSEVADLAAGAWGSVVATWDDGGGSAHVYQNGYGTNSATVTNAVSGTLGIWVGSEAGGGSSVEGEVANLFLYDQAMSGAQAESQHRAWLWTDILPGDEEWRGATSTMTITYDYDPLYRLTSASYSAGAEYEYTYDAVGNRQTMTSPDGETSYTYDAANRLTSVGGVAYTWDANGNLTSDGVRSYSYDHANRLTQVTQGSVTAEYVYNGDGVRISKTVAGETTGYALDLLATLPVVISDTDAVYLYGLDIIAQQQSERLYYMHDGLGSVRQLVDTTGQVEANYAYDPFGVPVAEGDESNPYRYTGEAWDGEVGLLYLRARYYQPEVGRFITKDPWGGDLARPATLNLYVYARNNPSNLVDPSGLQGCGMLPWPCQTQVVDPDPELRNLAAQLLYFFGIEVGKEEMTFGTSQDAAPNLYYVLWSNWSTEQLRLVMQAASDFAHKMQGGTADFRSKLAPVPLYKREGELVVFQPAGGWTNFTSVTLSGRYWDVEGGAWMKAAIVHELAHFWDLGFGNEGGRLSSEMASGFWVSHLPECKVPRRALVAAEPVVRDWLVGRTMEGLNPREDWADSVATYVYDGYAAAHKKQISEGRWYFVAEQMNPGNPQRFPWPEDWRSLDFRDTYLGTQQWKEWQEHAIESESWKTRGR